MKKISTKGRLRENHDDSKPPIDLQIHFAAVVEKVETLKSRYQRSLTDLESLYGALSQQAFKGELDLSRVQLPDCNRRRKSAVAEVPHCPRK